MLTVSTLSCCCQPPQPPAARRLPPRAADPAAGHLPDMLLPATTSWASARPARTSPALSPVVARSASAKTITPRQWFCIRVKWKLHPRRLFGELRAQGCVLGLFPAARPCCRLVCRQSASCTSR